MVLQGSTFIAYWELKWFNVMSPMLGSTIRTTVAPGTLASRYSLLWVYSSIGVPGGAHACH